MQTGAEISGLELETRGCQGVEAPPEQTIDGDDQRRHHDGRGQHDAEVVTVRRLADHGAEADG